MELIIFLKRILFGAVVLQLTFFSTPLSDAIRENSLKNGPVPLIEQRMSVSTEKESHGLPMRLKIPKIQVDAEVEYVGITPEGAMDITNNPEQAAWFEPGQRPGEIGSAVIAGHYGKWKNGRGSVFDNLHKLRKGDRLTVEDDKGAVISFVVRESRSYDPNADASDVFGSNDGNAHLNLITCEGTWNKAAESYSKRLVVFTDLLKEGAQASDGAGDGI